MPVSNLTVFFSSHADLAAVCFAGIKCNGLGFWSRSSDVVLAGLSELLSLHFVT